MTGVLIRERSRSLIFVYYVSHVTIGRLQGAMLRPFEDAAARRRRNGRDGFLILLPPDAGPGPKPGPFVCRWSIGRPAPGCKHRVKAAEGKRVRQRRPH
jgi:hypothetical protein